MNGYHCVLLLLYQLGLQIASLLNSTLYALELPRYPFAERGQRGISVLFNKGCCRAGVSCSQESLHRQNTGTHRSQSEKSESMRKRSGQREKGGGGSGRDKEGKESEG